MDLDMILNDCLNKAMCQPGRIKNPNSNKIAKFVTNYLEKNKEAINKHNECIYKITEDLKKLNESIISEYIDCTLKRSPGWCSVSPDCKTCKHNLRRTFL